ncbi:MAG: CPXCG motif-containing cysteine-rich protein [Planctomycetota bacterium]
MEGRFDCAACGEVVSLYFEPHDAVEDPSRRWVHDCPVCCRPNVLEVDFDLEAGEVFVRNELE